MSDVENFEQRLKNIEDRNRKVEADKAWETSCTRKVSIALLTYFVIVLYFYVIKTERPFINAIVPTVGFLLSTLTISFLKKTWLKRRNQKGN